jgi:hypothetical protein
VIPRPAALVSLAAALLVGCPSTSGDRDDAATDAVVSTATEDGGIDAPTGQVETSGAGEPKLDAGAPAPQDLLRLRPAELSV